MVAKTKQKLHMKDTIFLDEIKSLIKKSSNLHSQLLGLIFNKFDLRVFSHPQSKYCNQSVIKLLVLVKLLDVGSVHKLIQSDLAPLIPFCKDVFYKVKNSFLIDWRKLLLSQAYQSLDGIEIDPKPKAAHQLACFIVDDSDIKKRGYCIEFIGKIFSHVNHTYTLGFKSLNLALWTGKNLLHLNFSLHCELGKKKNQGLTNKQLKNRFSKKRPKDTPGHKRAKECYEKKTRMAIKMIKAAIAKGFKASYILADSWFFNFDMVQLAEQTKIHLISRPKFNNWQYQHNGKFYTIGQLCKKYKHKKYRKWSRKLKLHYVEVDVIFKGKSLKLLFYKSKKRGTKWQAIITTDLKISAIRAFQIYQTRWSIEVAFKELKQHLKYGSCQSQDFDAQIADLTQTLMAYNFLSQTKAINEYQSIGFLFEEVSRKWLSPTLMKRFWNYLYQVLNQIAELLDLSVNYLIEKCIEKNSFFDKMKLIYQPFSAET